MMVVEIELFNYTQGCCQIDYGYFVSGAMCEDMMYLDGYFDSLGFYNLNTDNIISQKFLGTLKYTVFEKVSKKINRKFLWFKWVKEVSYREPRIFEVDHVYCLKMVTGDKYYCKESVI